MPDVDAYKITLRLTDARPAISEATSRLASENDSSSNCHTEDPFASTHDGELEDNEIVVDDDGSLCAD